MPDRRRYARTPDTLVLLGACALVSGVLTVAGRAPASILALVPLWVALVWSGGFAFSAAMSLAGIIWRDELTGWVLELSGRVGLTLTAFGYFVALVAANTQAPGNGVAVAIVGGIAGASGWRIRQLTRRLDQFTAALNRRRGGSQ